MITEIVIPNINLRKSLPINGNTFLKFPDDENVLNANSLPANIPINTNVVDIGILLYCLK